jgi:hypothetical protein
MREAESRTPPRERCRLPLTICSQPRKCSGLPRDSSKDLWADVCVNSFRYNPCRDPKKHKQMHMTGITVFAGNPTSPRGRPQSTRGQSQSPRGQLQSARGKPHLTSRAIAVTSRATPPLIAGNRSHLAGNTTCGRGQPQSPRGQHHL